jgi:hypothetical protein
MPSLPNDNHLQEADMDESSELAQMKLKFEALEQRVKDLEESKRSAWWPDGEEADRVFIDMLRCLEPTSLQYLMRETTLDNWAKAAIMLSLDLLSKIRNNISAHVWDQFVDSAREEDSLRHVSSNRSQILRTMQQMYEMGMFYIDWEEPPLPRRKVTPLSVYPPNSPDPEAEAAEQRAAKELKDWMEGTLREAGRLPRQKQVDKDPIQV